eukprot:gb/GEZN01010525.1/.p1 GENE.gb/GEZN01010525.1/~~gb/GEZN01010525.1/.p1  ORF type:complete len:335 (-),score=59.08 gb/GEZN01010525.1/:204-1208(-)
MASAPKRRKITDEKETGSLLKTLVKLRAANFALDPSKKISEQPIYVCKRENRVRDVWKQMIKRNFEAIPVMTHEDKYHGFIDMYDIVSYIVSHFGGEDVFESQDFWEKCEASKDFNEKTVRDLMVAPLSTKNPFKPVDKNYSAFAVVEALAVEPSLHRVPIVDSNRTLWNLVTQFQVVQWLNKNKSLLGELRDIPIGEDFKKEVVTVPETIMAKKAFSKMVNNKVSAVALVDAAGKISGVLSLRDLKAVGADLHSFWRLDQTVHNFIEKVKKDFPDSRPRGVVTITCKDSIGTLLDKLEANKIHRVFVVNDKKEPIGVVSLKDVLAMLLDIGKL